MLFEKKRKLNNERHQDDARWEHLGQLIVSFTAVDVFLAVAAGFFTAVAYSVRSSFVWSFLSAFLNFFINWKFSDVVLGLVILLLFCNRLKKDF